MPHELRRPHFELPVSEAAAESLARLRANQEMDLRQLADAAKQVPALQASVLRAANAASNGLQHPVSTPEHAMAMLGSAKLKAIVDELCEQNETLRETTQRAQRTLPGDGR